MKYRCAYMGIKLTLEQVEIKSCRDKFGKKKCKYFYSLDGRDEVCGALFAEKKGNQKEACK